MPGIDYARWDRLADSDDEAAPGPQTRTTKVAEPTRASAEAAPTPSGLPALAAAVGPACDDLLRGFTAVPEAEDAGPALRSGQPVVLRGACACWPAAERWTWPFLLQRLGDDRLQVAGGQGSVGKAPLSFAALAARWWPDERARRDGEVAVGCSTWRALEPAARRELLADVRCARPRGVPRPGRLVRSMSGPPGPFATTRTALAVGEAGFVATPLRSAAFARHRWLACVRGALRCVVVPPGEACARALRCRDVSKGRQVSGVDPIRPDLESNPALRGICGLVCKLTEGDVLVVPSGCLLWSENLWASLTVRHCFLSEDNLVEFQQLLLREGFYSCASATEAHTAQSESRASPQVAGGNSAGSSSAAGTVPGSALPSQERPQIVEAGAGASASSLDADADSRACGAAHFLYELD